jgi:hypothetical protein
MTPTNSTVQYVCKHLKPCAWNESEAALKLCSRWRGEPSYLTFKILCASPLPRLLSARNETDWFLLRSGQLGTKVQASSVAGCSNTNREDSTDCCVLSYFFPALFIYLLLYQVLRFATPNLFVFLTSGLLPSCIAALLYVAEGRVWSSQPTWPTSVVSFNRPMNSCTISVCSCQ